MTNRVWIMPEKGPFCPIHKGQMKLNFPADRFECMGYDGEGCEQIVNMEEFVIEIGSFDTLPFRVE